MLLHSYLMQRLCAQEFLQSLDLYFFQLYLLAGSLLFLNEASTVLDFIGLYIRTVLALTALSQEKLRIILHINSQSLRDYGIKTSLILKSVSHNCELHSGSVVSGVLNGDLEQVVLSLNVSGQHSSLLTADHIVVSIRIVLALVQVHLGRGPDVSIQYIFSFEHSSIGLDGEIIRDDSTLSVLKIRSG